MPDERETPVSRICQIDSQQGSGGERKDRQLLGGFDE
jgi:hypothetical protein